MFLEPHPSREYPAAFIGRLFIYSNNLFRPDTKRSRTLKSQAKPAPSGVVSNWKKVVAAKEKAKRPMSSVSTSTTAATRLTRGTTPHGHVEEGNVSINYGGISSGDEEPERLGLESGRGSKSPAKHKVCFVNLSPDDGQLNIIILLYTVTRQGRGAPRSSCTCKIEVWS
jgi:hypothetical protein